MVLKSAINSIAKHGLLSRGDCVVVALSGGPDSVALLHLLLQLKEEYGLKLHIAHLNHLLRAEESARDALFVQQLAKRHKIPCTIKEDNAAEAAEEDKVSLQMAARKIRYRFLRQVTKDKGADKIALAHNADDQVETMLLRLLRGAGPEGLRAIEPRRGKLIRPLLETSRKEIIQFLNERGQRYRLDSSNEKTEYLRNKLRHELVPVLEREYNPRLMQNLLQLADVLREEESFWDEYIFEQLGMILIYQDSEQVVMDGAALKKMPLALQRRLCREAVERLAGSLQAISFNHVQQIIDALQEEKGEKLFNLPNNMLVIKQYDRLEVYRDNRPVTPLGQEYELAVPGLTEVAELEMKVETALVTAADFADNISRGLAPALCYLDWSKVKKPLRIRGRRPGDRFTPLGMKESKKLKDFLIDNKIPQSHRDTIPLLVHGDEIVWVMGVRVSENYKVRANTKEVLFLKVSNVFYKLHQMFNRKPYPVPNFQI